VTASPHPAPLTVVPPPPAPTALVVTGDAALARAVQDALAGAGMTCEQAPAGDDTLRAALAARPDLLLLDLAAGGAAATLARLRDDFRTRDTPALALSADGHADATVDAVAAGADDYLVTPVDPRELAARARLALRRAAAVRELSPLTGLPGYGAVLREVAARLRSDRTIACLHLDLDGFKSYNDRYGFARGDAAIAATARMVLDALEDMPYPDHLAGHLGGDDFIVLTAPVLAESLADDLTRRFDALAPGLYDDADRERGWIEAPDRARGVRQVPLMTLSVGIARTDSRRLDAAPEVTAVAAEMKAVAKRVPGSAWAVDRRR
jgi:PleD family two-component response regulator